MAHRVLHDIQIRRKKLWEALWKMDDKRKYEPEAVGLKKLCGRLISHCRRHPNLNLVHLAIKGNPYVLLESTKRIVPGEELMYDYGDRAKGLEDFMKHKNCICFKSCS